MNGARAEDVQLTGDLDGLVRGVAKAERGERVGATRADRVELLDRLDEPSIDRVGEALPGEVEGAPFGREVGVVVGAPFLEIEIELVDVVLLDAARGAGIGEEAQQVDGIGHADAADQQAERRDEELGRRRALGRVGQRRLAVGDHGDRPRLGGDRGHDNGQMSPMFRYALARAAR